METITSKNYVKEALRTKASNEEAASRLQNPDMVQILHGAIGICTESGELMDNLKKTIFYNKSVDYVNIVEELGDLLWYIALIADSCGVTLDEILSKNIEKLRIRYPEKFTEEKALNRDLEAERIIWPRVRGSY